MSSDCAKRNRHLVVNKEVFNFLPALRPQEDLPSLNPCRVQLTSKRFYLLVVVFFKPHSCSDLKINRRVKAQKT